MKILTLDHIVKSTGLDMDVEDTRALIVGLASRFLKSVPGNGSLFSALERIGTLVSMGQFKYYFDASGRNVGFATWAFTDAANIPKIIMRGYTELIHNKKINGTVLWVPDFHVSDGFYYEILHDLYIALDRSYENFFFLEQTGDFNRIHSISVKSTCPLGSSDETPDAPPRKSEMLLKDEAAQSLKVDFLKLIRLGTCLQFLLQHQKYPPKSAKRYINFLNEIIALRQYQIVELNKRPVAFIAWAWLSSRTIRERTNGNLHFSHPSEWNEGQALCVFYVAASDAGMAKVRTLIQFGLFPNEEQLLLYEVENTTSYFQTYCRPKNNICLHSWITRAREMQIF